MKCVVAKGDEIKTTIVKWKNILLEILFKVQRNVQMCKNYQGTYNVTKKCKNTFLTLNKIVNKGIYDQLSS